MLVNLNDVKFLCVLYPYSAGGNHLCNLLSTHEYFYQRFSSSNYAQDLLSTYENKALLELNLKTDDDKKILKSLSRVYNAHVWGGNPMNEITVIPKGDSVDLTVIHQTVKFHISVPKDELENTNISKKIICQGHRLEKALDVIPESKNKFLKQFWYNLQVPNFLAGIIMLYPKKQGRAYKRIHVANKDLISPINKEIYNLPFKVKGMNFFTENNAINIDTDLFCEDNGSIYLQDIIDEKFKIKLPNYIHDLHKLWVEMIDKSISLAESK